MPEYRYSARASDGTTKQDTMVAPDETMLRRNIEEMGLSIISIQEAHAHSTDIVDTNITWRDKLQSVKLVDKLFFTQNLQVMIRTGFAVSNALKTLSLQTRNKYFKKVILQIVGDVEAGTSLAESMKRFPKVFPMTLTSMISAGEASGQLEAVLERLSIQMKKDHQIISKVRGALIYPVIILSAMVLIGTAMLIFVIPKITDLYSEADVQLPLATRILIGLSDSIQAYGLWYGAGAVVVVVALIRLVKSKSGKPIWHKILIRLPIAGRIIRQVNLARFMRTLNSLLSTDIPIVKAFEIISNTLGNTEYRTLMKLASESVKRGDTISNTLMKWPNLFPPVTTQIIQVGEQSGTLDEITADVAEFYEQEVDQTMGNLSTVIEPVLMLVLGVAVGGMAVAIVSPMYNLVNTI